LVPYEARLRITHLRSAIRNANHARNLGLRAARGKIVTFPDDDCLYPAGVLARVDAAFLAVPSLGVLTGPAASPEGGLGSGRWREASGAIDVTNVWTSVIEFNLFLPRQLMLALGGFDEKLGPGTRWGSAEGNDLVCRAMAGGAVAQYDAGLRIIHPDKRLTEVAVSRAASYGRGLGFVLRRHGVPLSVWFAFLVRPIGGALISLAKLRFHNAAYYGMSFWGRLVGGLAREAREAPLPAPLQGSA
jgi:glycosyltransferase involved in cell wall biosynthesis